MILENEIDKGLQVVTSLNKFYENIEYFEILRKESISKFALRQTKNEHIRNTKYTNGITCIDNIWFITLYKLADILNLSSTESIEKMLEERPAIKFIDDTVSFYRLTDILSCFSKILYPFKQKSLNINSIELSRTGNCHYESGNRNDNV